MHGVDVRVSKTRPEGDIASRALTLFRQPGPDEPAASGRDLALLPTTVATLATLPAPNPLLPTPVTALATSTSTSRSVTSRPDARTHRHRLSTHINIDIRRGPRHHVVRTAETIRRAVADAQGMSLREAERKLHVPMADLQRWQSRPPLKLAGGGMGAVGEGTLPPSRSSLPTWRK